MRMETKPNPATLCSPLKMRQCTRCTNLVILSTIYHPQNPLKHSKICEILSYKYYKHYKQMSTFFCPSLREIKVHPTTGHNGPEGQ